MIKPIDSLLNHILGENTPKVVWKVDPLAINSSFGTLTYYDLKLNPDLSGFDISPIPDAQTPVVSRVLNLLYEAIKAESYNTYISDTGTSPVQKIITLGRHPLKEFVFRIAISEWLNISDLKVILVDLWPQIERGGTDFVDIMFPKFKLEDRADILFSISKNINSNLLSVIQLFKGIDALEFLSYEKRLNPEFNFIGGYSHAIAGGSAPLVHSSLF